MTAARASELPTLSSDRRERIVQMAETPDMMLAAARQYANEGRESHVLWAEHLDPGDPCAHCVGDPATMRAVGGYREQMEWVRKYDVILAVLDLVDETLAIRLVDAVARLKDEALHDQAVRLARHALRYRKEAHAR